MLHDTLIYSVLSVTCCSWLGDGKGVWSV